MRAKHLHLLYLFLFVLMSPGVYSQNLGFETPAATPPTDWAVVSGTWTTDTNAANVRTGQHAMSITDPATTGSTMGNTVSVVSVPVSNVYYLISMVWAKSNNGNGVLYLGHRRGTTNTLNPSVTSSGQPANMGTGFTRIISVSNGTVPAGDYSVSMRAFRTASITGTEINIDDAFIYASTSNIADTVSPDKVAAGTVHSGAPYFVKWTSGADTAANSSGIKGVVVLRSPGVVATLPVLSSQVRYHELGGVYGISSVTQSGNTWDVVKVTTDSFVSSCKDFSAIDGNVYTYAVISYDQAGNYSDAVLITPTPGSTMTYSGSKFTQQFIDAEPGQSAVFGGRIAIHTTGNTNALRVTDMNFSGLAAPANVSRVRVFTTGDTNVFDTTHLFGSITSPGSSFTISGSDTLYVDSNYYWLVFDIAPGATSCGVIDVSLDAVTVGGSGYVPSLSNPPGQIDVWSPLSGTYTINSALNNSCASRQFSSIRAAAEILGKYGMSGPVVLNIAPGSGPYTGQVSFGEIAGSSAINTITINGNNNVLQHDPLVDSKYILQFNGTDYVTVDHLVITSLSADYGWGIHLMNQADHNTIRYCTVDLSGVTATAVDNSACVTATNSITDIPITGENASYLTLIGDTLIGGYSGINLANIAGSRGSKNQVLSCVVRDFYSSGIEMTHQDSAVVARNNISRAQRTTVTTFAGVELGAGNQRVVVDRNKIHDTHNAASLQTGTAYGVYSTACDADIDSENVVTNNVIYNFNAGTGTQYGLYNSSSNGVKYYHNSIILDDAASTSGTTRGFYQTTLATNIDLRNNLFYITRAGSGTKNVLYFNTATSSIVSNNNVLYINAPAGTNSIGYYSGNKTTLADWQAANGGIYDGQSKDLNPDFDLNFAPPLYIPTRVAINNTGATVGVAEDYTGAARGASPDPGAFEFTPAATLDASISWISPLSPVASGNSTIVVEITNNLTDPLSSVELEYTDGSIVRSQLFSSLNITTGNSQQLSFTTPYSFTTSVSLRAYIKSVNGTTDAGQGNDTTLTQDICVGMNAGTYTINSALPTGSGNYNSFTSAVNALSCGILGPVTFVVDPASGPYIEQVTIPAVSGSGANAKVTFKGNMRRLEASPTVSAERYLIRLDGADHIVIDSLQIVAGTSPTYGWGVHLTNGADSNTISNCIIDMSTVTSTTQSNSACIVGSGSTTSVTTDGEANRNLITGNTLIGAYQGIIINGLTGAIGAVKNVISNNTIQDFYANGIELTDNDSVQIIGNNIHRANRVGVTTFVGVELGSGTKNAWVFGNKIHDTHNSASSQSGTSYGIYSNSDDAPVGEENIVSNNLIYHFNAGTGTQYGIYNSGSNGIKYYYNAISLDNAASTSGTTRGLYQTTAATGIEILNNIISVTRGGSGTKYCMYFGTTTSAIISNYNDLYISAPAGSNYVGYYSTSQATLANWRTVNANAYDQNSVSVNPLFNAPDDLRPYTGSTLVNSGTPVSVTTDITGALRSASTPTIGAYENVGDYANPVIIVNPITNTVSTTNRSFTGLATVTDRTGVNTTSAKPRIYYKKASDNNTFAGNTSADNGWKYTEATNTSSPFDFTIDYSIIFGGFVSQGDTIQYFVTAQDVSANTNVGIHSGKFNNTPASVSLTAAAFPVSGDISFYRVLPILPGGIFTVGNSGNYLNLTEVSNLLKGVVISGDITFELLPDYVSSGETFPVAFNSINKTNTSIQVTIRPASFVATPLITEGETPNGEPLIDLDGVKRLTFDGRAGGFGDTSNIIWTIRNKRNAATFSPVFRLTNDAISNTLQYLNIQSANALSTSGTVLISTTTGTEGNDSNTIRYNIIRDRSDSIGKPANAIYAEGTDGATNDHNTIYGNRIFDWGTTGVYVLAAGNGDNWTISGNHFYMKDSFNTAQTAIRFLTGGISNRIDSNVIGGVAMNAASDPWVNYGNIAWRGIVCTVGTTDTNYIRHNYIRNVRLNGTGSGTYAGIEVTAGLVNVMNNYIGDSTVANSIQSALLGTHLNITITSAPIVKVDGNIIASITSVGTTGAIGLRGITHTGTNTTEPVIISNNRIMSLTAATQTESLTTAAIQGIYTDITNKDQRITGNVVSHLSSDGGPGGTYKTKCIGINVNDATGSGVINGNLVYDFMHTGVSPDAKTIGIQVLAGEDWTVSNNMVSLGSSVTSDVQVIGISDSAVGTVRMVFNSVLISGTNAGSNAAVRSFAFQRGRTSQSTVSGNIFNNTRAGGGSHFAISNTSGSLVSDYNDLYSQTTATLGEWHGVAKDFAGWKAASSRDLNSANLLATFMSLTDLHLNFPTLGNNAFAARPAAGVTTDFDQEMRASAFPYMGADENVMFPLTVFLPPLTGTFTIGASGSYFNITSAANALNNSELVGNVVFELLNDYNDSNEAYPIVFNEFLSTGGAWTATIRPAAATTGRYTSGDPGSGLPLIRFNGADRLVFDGRPGGTGSTSEWSLRNTRSATTYGPAIELINDADENTIQYLTLMSGNTLTSSGTIVIGGTTRTTGNDSNVVRFNKIRDLDSASGIHANAIYCEGTAGATNDYNTISNNELFNFTSTGILVAEAGNGGNWTIEGNHLYRNQATIPATAQTGINFQALSDNNVISGNYIGGSMPNAGGAAWTNSGSNLFMGISVSTDVNGYTLVTGNTVSNIQKTATGAASFAGIRMIKGMVKIMNNTIGSATVANSITTSGTSYVYGIEVQNTTGTADTVVVSGNTVANISVTGTSTGSRIRGISFGFGDLSPITRITNNTVHHLSTTGTAVSYSVDVIAATGIMAFPNTYRSGSIVQNNTVHDIEAANTGTSGTMSAGISASNYAGELSNNHIYNIRNLSSASTGTTTAVAAGLYARFLSNGMVLNNMISINGTGSSDSVQLNGILIAGNGGGTHNYYYNSVHVTNGSAGTVNSFGFHRGQNNVALPSAHPIFLRNNIFQNTSTSTGAHYAIGVEDTAVTASGASDWNVFNAPDTAQLGLWGQSVNNLASWRSKTTSDVNSKIATVNFANVATADLHLAGASIGDLSLIATPVVVTVDIDGDPRDLITPYAGADENTSAPLPVKLVQFKAEKQANDVLLTWATSSEKNAAYYVVQRSDDNRSFTDIGRVKAKGNSLSLTRYSMPDERAFINTGANVLYYRLKMTDADGSSQYSTIAVVSNDRATREIAFTAYPNPFNSEVYINLESVKAGNALVKVTDISGKEVITARYELVQGTNTLELRETAALKAGVYFVVIETGEGAQSTKLIKQ